MSSASPNDLLDDALYQGVVTELFRAEQYWALGREISQNVPVINQTRAIYLFGEFQSLLAKEIALALNKAFEPVNRRYPIRSIPVALKILDEYKNDLKIIRKDFLTKKLVGYGLDEIQLGTMTDTQLTQEVHKYFSSTLPVASNSDDLSQALDTLKRLRDKTIAHHEAVDFSTIPVTTFKHVYDLMSYVREFLETVGSGYTGLLYSKDSNWFFGNKQSEELASDLRWLLERAGLVAK
jgi:hypothetical protein